MKKQNSPLTHEYLSSKFASHFEMVNRSIELAHNLIVSGRRPFVSTRIENPAVVVLLEMTDGQDKMVPIETKEEELQKQVLVMAQQGAKMVQQVQRS